VASDDSIWFRHPSYGTGGNYQGMKAEQEQSTRNVYRVDGRTGEVKMVIDSFIQPNGLAFSPDEKKLNIIDAALRMAAMRISGFLMSILEPTSSPTTSVRRGLRARAYRRDAYRCRSECLDEHGLGRRRTACAVMPRTAT
jgi:hypothetical protein